MKRVLSVVVLLCFCALLLAFSDTVKSSALEALRIWASQLVPVLFPFFVCADMLRRLHGHKLSFPLLFLMSMTAGAPAGARLCADIPLKEKTRTDIAAALNMISPMFIFSAYCAGMLKNALFAFPILLAQYISAALMLRVSCRSMPRDIPEIDSPAASLFTFGSVVYDAVCAMLSIGGTIVVFRVTLSVFGALFSLIGISSPHPAVTAALAGFFEFVNGCYMLSSCDIPASYVCAVSAFVFSFGGLCVMAQSMSFCKILPGRYILRKLTQGIIAAIIAYALSSIFFKYNKPVFLNVDTALIKFNVLSALGMFCASSLSLSLLWIMQFAIQKNKAARKRAAK